MYTYRKINDKRENRWHNLRVWYCLLKHARITNFVGAREFGWQVLYPDLYPDFPAVEYFHNAHDAFAFVKELQNVVQTV